MLSLENARYKSKPKKNPQESEIELAKILIERTNKERGELIDSWKALDNKAQAIATMTGAFMAYLLNLIGGTGYATIRSAQFFICLMLIFSLTSMISVFLALAVRKIPSPQAGNELVNFIEKILDFPATEREQRYIAVLHDSGRDLAFANSKLESMVQTKGMYVGLGQSAIGCLVFLMILMVFNHVALIDGR